MIPQTLDDPMRYGVWGVFAFLAIVIFLLLGDKP